MKGKTVGMEKPELALEQGALLRFIDPNTDAITGGIFIGTGDNGDFVVVPLSENKSQPAAGAMLHGRCLFMDNMVAFKSRIVEITDHPVTLWRIHAPTDVKKYDLRQNKRIQCSVSAYIEAIHKGQVLTGIIRDISKSGARCLFNPSDAIESPFEVDEPVTLRCVFPGIPGEQAARGKITDIIKTEDEFSLAVRFTESVWWVPPYH